MPELPEENYNYKLSTQYSASHNDILLTPSLSEGFFYLFSQVISFNILQSLFY